jgi:chemotaxis protein histidine kinase CheA
MDLSAFLEEFKLEAGEHLERLGAGLLALERDPGDAELIRKLFLSAHTIKGGASMLEFGALKNLTHAFEDVLARLRDTTDRADSATVTLLLRACDAIQDLVVNDPTRAALGDPLEPLAGALRARARGETVALESVSQAPTSEADSSLANSEDPSESSSDAAQIKTPRALVLEPSDTARLLLRLQLEERGWTVADCADESALLAEASEAQLAVVPLEPGGVDGVALAQRLRAQDNALQVAVSALEFSDAERAVLEGLGARAVVLEPWNRNPYWSAQ